jgi:hypothetical protein
MGRGNVIRAAVAAVLAGLVVAASGAAAISWKVVADGASTGTAAETPLGYLALDRTAETAFSARLPQSGKAKLAGVGLSSRAVLAIFGDFGCTDSLVVVSSIAQHGTTLAVRLIRQAPPAGTVECMAIFGTYRLLSLPRAGLSRPYPTRVAVTLATA